VKDIWIDQKILLEKPNTPAFHPKKQANIEIMMDGKENIHIWFIWAFHPVVLQNWKIQETAGVVYIWLDLGKLIQVVENIWEKKYQYETLQDQIIWRDLCFVVDVSKNFDAVIDAVKKVPEIKDIEVFDVYAGNNLGEDKKSVSIKIKMVGDWTMTTEQINDVMNKAIKAAEKSGGTLRT